MKRCLHSDGPSSTPYSGFGTSEQKETAFDQDPRKRQRVEPGISEPLQQDKEEKKKEEQEVKADAGPSDHGLLMACIVAALRHLQVHEPKLSFELQKCSWKLMTFCLLTTGESTLLESVVSKHHEGLYLDDRRFFEELNAESYDTICQMARNEKTEKELYPEGDAFLKVVLAQFKAEYERSVLILQKKGTDASRVEALKRELVILDGALKYLQCGFEAKRRDDGPLMLLIVAALRHMQMHVPKLKKTLQTIAWELTVWFQTNHIECTFLEEAAFTQFLVLFSDDKRPFNQTLQKDSVAKIREVQSKKKMTADQLHPEGDAPLKEKLALFRKEYRNEVRLLGNRQRCLCDDKIVGLYRETEIMEKFMASEKYTYTNK